MLIDEKAKKYYPTLYVNDFWVYREHYKEVNETTKELPITFTFEPKEHWKWTLMVQMEESFSMQKNWGTYADGDSDDIKRMISETNIWLLVLTGAVSLLHMTFDFLAFKNGFYLFYFFYFLFLFFFYFLFLFFIFIFYFYFFFIFYFTFNYF